MRNVAKACAVVLAIVGILIVAGIHLSRYHSTKLLPPTSRGRKAPNFALLDAQGKVVRLSDYRGKVVLVNFFGDTCVPCRQESPWLVDIKKRNAANGLEIIGIEMYGASDKGLKQYCNDFGTNYIVVHGNRAVSDEYGIGEFPTSYFVGARGTIVAATVGLHSENEIEANVEAALRSE